MTDLRKGQRLTPEYLKSRIAATEFETKTSFGQMAVFCHLQLDNGFVIYGSKPSMAIDPANFDKALGEKYAYDNTFAELWQLFAFSQLEKARDLEQYRDTYDLHSLVEVIGSERYRDMSLQGETSWISTRLKIISNGYLFKVNTQLGEDPREKILEVVREQLGASAISHPRVVMIAKACHEANRGYCAALGDTSQLPWNEAPEWQRVSAIKGVEFHLSGEHGPEASHESWYAEKEADGWVYGPVKDAEKKEHPCMVAYSQLPKEQQAKDYIFRSVVHSFK
ncbi:hypothetical protein HWB57_gp100 [Erwinia phage vB_EamM-Bue1]|uniref:Ryanodine receptor Ryr domain-containing protein n=1 Tax=Erwinia phage vB_EamM-Bue1 TaxID=2099338 RepID=A0A2P1JUA7_9CAUD|nr:hypothetical protein HWB57_gp100 [Erwinia phage vB_EamM-Bue1]AVO22940.1 hypothetical protein [Erwinia phage vB_EamM-Bue1]